MRLAYLLLLLSSHAFAGTKLDPASAPETDAVRGNVVVWHDALFFAEPSESARTLQLATFEGARKDRVGHVIALKVVSGKGAFVEVELTGQQDCGWSRVVVPDDLARVRMFVRRADLAPVIVKPFTKAFADGTSITIAPGTPVLATDAGTFVVSVRGDEVEVDVPAASIGYGYASAKTRRAIMTADTLAVAAGANATLGERTLALSAWQASLVERRGDSSLVSIHAGCSSAQVLVPSKALSDADETDGDLAASDDANDVMSLRDEFFLPKLTQLTIGARSVAVAAKPIYLHDEPMGKNACIQRAIRIESALEVKRTDDKLRLCAPATKVMRERLRSARSAPR